MEAKKSIKANLQDKRGIFAKIGLIISLILVTSFFNISQGKLDIEIVDNGTQDVVVDLPPVTIQDEEVKQKVAKVVPPSITDRIEIVDNTIEIEDTDIFNPETDEITPNWAGLPIGPPNNGTDITLSEDAPVFKAEVEPTFGGEEGGAPSRNAFRKWVQRRVQYPMLVMESRIAGTVSLKFVIGKDGRIKDITIISSPDKLLTEEVIRVMQSAPAWTPGLQREQPVSVYGTLNVVFVL